MTVSLSAGVRQQHPHSRGLTLVARPRPDQMVSYLGIFAVLSHRTSRRSRNWPIPGDRTQSPRRCDAKTAPRCSVASRCTTESFSYPVNGYRVACCSSTRRMCDPTLLICDGFGEVERVGRWARAKRGVPVVRSRPSGSLHSSSSSRASPQCQSSLSPPDGSPRWTGRCFSRSPSIRDARSPAWRGICCSRRFSQARLRTSSRRPAWPQTSRSTCFRTRERCCRWWH
jgi:hypothetical protein